MRPRVGFRYARVCMADREECVTGNLSSPVATRYIWHPGRNIAYCDPGGLEAGESEQGHTAPAPGCFCGLYGWHSLQTLLRIVRAAPVGRFDFRRHWRVPHRLDWLIVVAVTAWGTIRVHEQGWRAQYAQIVALSDELPLFDIGNWPMPGHALRYGRVIEPGLARTIAKRYRAPMVPLNRLTGVASRAGVITEPPRNAELLEEGDVDLGPELAITSIGEPE